VQDPAQRRRRAGAAWPPGAQRGRDIGFPVVLKPQDGNQGKGVTVGITERAQLDAAYQAAARYGGVMV